MCSGHYLELLGQVNPVIARVCPGLQPPMHRYIFHIFQGYQTKHLIFQSGRIQLINKLPKRFRLSHFTLQI